MLECIVNVSEGRDREVLDALRDAGADDLLDVHVDAHHHRCVLTTVGEDAARRIARVAVARIDLRTHVGAHPRLGAVDVVPFVALDDAPPADACAARSRFATWIADELAVPAFTYGDGDGVPALPEVRRRAFAGPLARHRTEPAPSDGRGSGGGLSPPLVAYNLWLAEPDLELARSVASAVRGDGIRALGLAVGDRVQVSMNLIDPDRVGPAMAYDRVAERAAVAGRRAGGAAPPPGPRRRAARTVGGAGPGRGPDGGGPAGPLTAQAVWTVMVAASRAMAR